MALSHAWVRLCALSLVALLPIVISPWGPDAYAGSKALLLSALTALMILGWVAGAVTVREPAWQTTAQEFPLWVFILFLLLSTWTTVDARATVLGAFGRAEGLPAVLAYCALFFVGVHYFGSRDGMAGLVRVLAAASVPVLVYGLARWWVPPLFPGEARLQDAYWVEGPRVFSLVGGPVVYGGYLCLIAPVAVSQFLAERRTWRAALWLGIGGLAVVSTVLTLSRAAWLALTVGGAIFLSGALAPAVRLHRRRVVVAGISAVAAAAVLLAAVHPTRVLSRGLAALDTSGGSTAQHLYIWKQTIGLIAQRPVLGWGLETLGTVFPYTRTELVPLFGVQPPIIDRAHNDLLHVAVSIGVPGAAAYAAFWILAVLVAVRLVRRTHGAARLLAAGWMGALVGYLVQAQFSFTAVAVTPLVMLLAGAAAGWEASPASGHED